MAIHALAVHVRAQKAKKAAAKKAEKEAKKAKAAAKAAAKAEQSKKKDDWAGEKKRKEKEEKARKRAEEEAADAGDLLEGLEGRWSGEGVTVREEDAEQHASDRRLAGALRGDPPVQTRPPASMFSVHSHALPADTISVHSHALTRFRSAGGEGQVDSRG